MTITPAQVDAYKREGWISPIDVLPVDEATRLADELSAAEAAFPEQLHAENRNNAHLAVPFLADLTTHPAVVSAVQALIGADLALWSTVLFIKEPDTSAFVSWHQDAYYMGLEPQNFVTAWLALTPSTIESGCVSVIPGSHKGRLDHHDSYGDDNILTRGQHVGDVDASNAVHLELQPGQMSLHHPWIVHGSQPNRSGSRRVGFAMQSFLGADVRPTRGEHHVLHVSGRPLASEFVEVEKPATTFGPNETVTREAANRAMASVLYDGAREKRRRVRQYRLKPSHRYWFRLGQGR